MPAPGTDPAKVANVHDQELKKFVDARPRTMALLERARAHMPNGVPMVWMATDNEVPVYVDRGEGAGFSDVDGHRYLDVNVADMSMFCGYANPAIVDAVAERARAGTQFLLPSAEAVEVAEELAGRYPVPFWQFTLSASQANVEAIRVARRDRARGRAPVRRPLPRPLRRGSDRSAGRPARPRPAGSGQGDRRQGPDRSVQRRRRSAAGPGAAGRRHRPHRAGAHQ
mgnify:CR=1 FL=1